MLIQHPCVESTLCVESTRLPVDSTLEAEKFIEMCNQRCSAVCYDVILVPRSTATIYITRQHITSLRVLLFDLRYHLIPIRMRLSLTIHRSTIAVESVSTVAALGNNLQPKFCMVAVSVKARNRLTRVVCTGRARAEQWVKMQPSSS